MSNYKKIKIKNRFNKNDILSPPKNFDLSKKLIATNQCKVDYEDIFQYADQNGILIRAVSEIDNGLIRFMGDTDLWFSQEYFHNFLIYKRQINYEVYE